MPKDIATEFEYSPSKFNVGMLQSGIFKIILPGISSVDSAASESSTEDTGSASSGLDFYVQKELLASLSEELRKHVHNNMKEGQTGEMVLKEVDKVTLEHFLQWAYTQDYTIEAETEPELMLHVKLYVLADRFNVVSLQRLCLSRVAAILADHPVIKRDFELNMSIVLNTTAYAADNLPDPTTEPLLKYMLRFIAWGLASARTLPEFPSLVHAHTDAAVALFQFVNLASWTPWSLQVEANTPSSDEQCIQCKKEPARNLLCATCESSRGCETCVLIRKKISGICVNCSRARG